MTPSRVMKVLTISFLITRILFVRIPAQVVPTAVETVPRSQTHREPKGDERRAWGRSRRPCPTAFSPPYRSASPGSWYRGRGRRPSAQHDPATGHRAIIGNAVEPDPQRD